jgi:hypothetical protein
MFLAIFMLHTLPHSAAYIPPFMLHTFATIHAASSHFQLMPFVQILSFVRIISMLPIFMQHTFGNFMLHTFGTILCCILLPQFMQHTFAKFYAAYICHNSMLHAGFKTSGRN